MKTLFMFTFLTLLPFSAQANDSDWLTCSTEGNALTNLHVAINTVSPSVPSQIDANLFNGKGEVIEALTTGDMSNDSYAKMVQDDRFDLVLKTQQTTESGGGASNSSLLTLKPGSSPKIPNSKYKGYFADRGTVYSIFCTKDSDN